ncbi:hypothetical protein HYQ45_007544 [Verticillium longisporum]
MQLSNMMAKEGHGGTCIVTNPVAPSKLDTTTNTTTPTTTTRMASAHEQTLEQTLQGTYIDTIASVSEPVSSSTDIHHLITLLTLAYNVRTPSATQQDRLATLMRTLSSDRLSHVRTPAYPHGFSREEVTHTFGRLLSPVLNGLTGLVEFEHAVNAEDDAVSFRQFWTLDDRNLLADAVAGTSPPVAASATAVPPEFLETFVGDKTAHRIALTRDRGMLALVPGCVGAEDEIWSVSELSAPVILRKEAGEGEPAVVEGYVHGFCDGDVERGGEEEEYRDVDLPLSSVAVGLAGSIPC